MKKLAFLFPGQGVQYPGMAEDVCQSCPESAAAFEQACHALGRDIRTLAFRGPREELNRTRNTQPALLAAEIALWRALDAHGVVPDMLAGSSLGEWAALVAAGCLDYQEAVALVNLRAEAMQAAVPEGQGGMAAIIGKSAAFVERLCREAEGYAAPSNYNCPVQTTIAGEARAVEFVMRRAEEEGGRVRKLPVSIPSHCRLMQPAAQRLREPVRAIRMREPQRPVYTNVSAQAAREVEEIREELISQLILPVRLEWMIRNMIEAGAETFVEIGPGNTLCGFVEKTAAVMQKEVRALPVSDEKSLKAALAVLAE